MGPAFSLAGLGAITFLNPTILCLSLGTDGLQGQYITSGSAPIPPALNSYRRVEAAVIIPPSGGSDEKFLHLLDRVEDESTRIGLKPVMREDGSALYALSYLYTALHSSREREIVALDLGAGIGYSTLWIARGIEEACIGRCRVVAVEREESRYHRLRMVLSEAGLRSIELEAVHADALKYLMDLPDESIDMAFVDVEKGLYPLVLRTLEDKLRYGGVAVFHNAFYPKPSEMFLKTARRWPWKTTIVPTRLGLLVAVKMGGGAREAGL
ncbi:hypothetical protein Pdsh_04135 [Pyrodictium delaneyi]|uniref:O-methyltransferase n=1 Tax=Pyrodictium delaneyi TaxID=1273541 RepID=A0A211YPC5_9CREN|nr:hypothetical protein Pdsh_04135 [Pyrodictium delaneyi]